MPLQVSFELNDDDLKHFELIMREARKAASGLPPEAIVAKAESLLQAVGDLESTCFVVERMRKLRLMIHMLSDLEWRLPHQDASRVLNALAYFAEPEDLIPDGIPGLGFLDDAIMIELVVRELKPEIEAYEDFCAYRDRVRADGGDNTAVSREDWLDDRRNELQTRMRRRRKK